MVYLYIYINSLYGDYLYIDIYAYRDYLYKLKHMYMRADGGKILMFPRPVIMLVAFLYLLLKGSMVQKEAISIWMRKQPCCPF